MLGRMGKAWPLFLIILGIVLVVLGLVVKPSERDEPLAYQTWIRFVIVGVAAFAMGAFLLLGGYE